MSGKTHVVMNSLTGRPYATADGDAVPVVWVPVGEQAEWERSWIGKQSLLALMPLRDLPSREAGSQR